MNTNINIEKEMIEKEIDECVKALKEEGIETPEGVNDVVEAVFNKNVAAEQVKKAQEFLGSR